MRSVDHDFVGFATTSCHFDQDTPEYAYLVSPDQAVVNYLVRLVAWWPITPPKAIADDIDVTADHSPLMAPQYAVRQGAERRNSRHLRA